jgi:5-methylcytosine-specific restriction endonuclease McrA
MAMLKSCSYCGGIHARTYQCPSKPKRIKDPTYIDKFRWSRRWATKRKQINERDKYLCQVCMRKLHNTHQQYNFANIEVHHIVPIVEDYHKRLDDDNLICLCSYHHKMAESGEISRNELFEILKQQEKTF